MFKGMQNYNRTITRIVIGYRLCHTYRVFQLELQYIQRSFTKSLVPIYNQRLLSLYLTHEQ